MRCSPAMAALRCCRSRISGRVVDARQEGQVLNGGPRGVRADAQRHAMRSPPAADDFARSLDQLGRLCQATKVHSRTRSQIRINGTAAERERERERERVSHSPLKDRAFSASSDKSPLFELRPENEFSASLFREPGLTIEWSWPQRDDAHAMATPGAARPVILLEGRISDWVDA